MKPVLRPLALALAVAAVPLSAPSALTAATARQTAPDNTAVNKRDRTGEEPTAQQQSNSRADVEMSRQIRRAIVADKGLSTYAHNIKIITRNGQVTLKGPVRSAEEQASVQAKAAEVA